MGDHEVAATDLEIQSRPADQPTSYDPQPRLVGNYITPEYLLENKTFVKGDFCKMNADIRTCCEAFQSPVWRDGYCFYHSPLHLQYEYLKRKYAECGEQSGLPPDNKHHKDWVEMITNHTHILAQKIRDRFNNNIKLQSSGITTIPSPRNSYIEVGRGVGGGVGGGGGDGECGGSEHIHEAPHQQSPKSALHLDFNAVRKKMHVVFDLDETLVYTTPIVKQQSKPKTRSYSTSLSTRSFVLGKCIVNIRPYALELLQKLQESDFPVYVLSSSPEEYCFSVCDYLNTFSTRDKPYIVNCSSCRINTMNGVYIMKKHFNQVLPPGTDINHAIAVDNHRKAWERSVRDQVMCIPDYDTMDPEGKAVLLVIMAQLRLLNASFSQNAKKTVSDVLAEHYENQEKRRILRIANSLKITDDVIDWDSSVKGLADYLA
eukprot:TRINITY_DN2874_c0_g1_i1.p2 TRINITY_DN2874_c0_g1~~TRINITY_DN2874_c0_g1_i1.p2  ORF type:complete len:430 (-),score=103.12 TRINITY_DN2874_c0_g1_i1:906-2195(-)